MVPSATYIVLRFFGGSIGLIVDIILVLSFVLLRLWITYLDPIGLPFSYSLLFYGVYCESV